MSVVMEIRQSRIKGGVSKKSGQAWNALAVVGFVKEESGELRAFDDMLFLKNPQPVDPGLYTPEISLRVRDGRLQPEVTALKPVGK
jgi:hypothetical protein